MSTPERAAVYGAFLAGALGVSLLLFSGEGRSRAAIAATPDATPPPAATPSIQSTPVGVPSDLVNGCGRTGPRASNGKAVGLGGSNSILRVDIPPDGTFFTLPGGPGADVQEIALYICHVESGSSIIISAVDGRELRRSVGTAGGAAVLDQILASARLEALPQPVPQPPPPSVPGLRPPSTGDAGLKR